MKFWGTKNQLQCFVTLYSKFLICDAMAEVPRCRSVACQRPCRLFDVEFFVDIFSNVENSQSDQVVKGSFFDLVNFFKVLKLFMYNTVLNSGSQQFLFHIYRTEKYNFAQPCERNMFLFYKFKNYIRLKYAKFFSDNKIQFSALVVI
jgi:hypothetical protein